MIQSILALLIPLVAVVMGIGVAMLSIYFNYRKRKELFTLYHQERMAAIEKGIELPPIPDAFFSEDTPRPKSPRRDLLKGLVWLFLGMAAGTAVYANDKPKEALFALIPAGIGLAYLIYYFVEGRRQLDPATLLENPPKIPQTKMA
jgi:peptidoglycan/LPS O-acetylase OafA/YrhL